MVPSLPSLNKVIENVTTRSQRGEMEQITFDDEDIGAEVEVATSSTTPRRNTRSQQIKNLEDAKVSIERLTEEEIKTPQKLTEIEQQTVDLEKHLTNLVFGEGRSAIKNSKRRIVRLKEVISLLEKDRDEKAEEKKRQAELKEINRKLKIYHEENLRKNV